MWEGISGKLGDPEKLGWGGRRKPQNGALSREPMNRHLQVTDLVPLNRAPGPSVHLPESISPATKVSSCFLCH